MLQNLVQSLARASRSVKGINEPAKNWDREILRICSCAYSPATLLESDFTFGQSLDVQLRSPTAVHVTHGSPYQLHAEWTGEGNVDRFTVVEGGDKLRALLSTPYAEPALVAGRAFRATEQCACDLQR